MNVEKWSANDFREALTARPKGEKYVTFLHQYPHVISIDEKLHSLLNTMRAASFSDGKDRYNVIFADRSHRSIATATPFTAATEDFADISRQGSIAQGKEFGLDPVLYAHSYYKDILPTDLLRHVLQAVFANHISSASSKDAAIPSIDVYRILANRNPVLGLVVVGGEENLLALKAMETYRPVSSYGVNDKDQIVDYWTNQWREEYISGCNPNHFRLNWRNLLDVWTNPLAVNIAMADKYRFALYRGETNGDLERVYPS